MSPLTGLRLSFFCVSRAAFLSALELTCDSPSSLKGNIFIATFAFIVTITFAGSRFDNAPVFVDASFRTGEILSLFV
jgi:hypothetical protein